MLTRLRPRIAWLVEAIASPLARLPAWVYTLSTLGLLAAYIYSCLHGNVAAAIILASLAGLMDGIDGAVARIRGEAGRKGAFLDSLVDRIADAGLGLGFILLGYPVVTVYVATVSALLVSYIRARFESLETSMSLEGVGILERAERILLQLLVLLLHLAYGLHVAVHAYTIYTVLVVVTVIERGYRAYKLIR